MSAPKLVLRFDRRDTGFRLWILVSILAHVGGFFGIQMLQVKQGLGPAIDPDSFDVVSLVATAPARGAVQPPPQIESVPEPEPVVVDRPKPPEPEPEAVNVEETRPVSESDDEGEAEPAPEADAGEGLVETGSAEGVGAIDLGGLRQAWYRSAVAAALSRNWRPPILESEREPLTVMIAFDVVRSGEVGNVRILVPSGIRELDRSVLRAVSDASPLPPLPASYKQPMLSDARVRFRWLPEGYEGDPP